MYENITIQFVRPFVFENITAIVNMVIDIM